MYFFGLAKYESSESMEHILICSLHDMLFICYVYLRCVYYMSIMV